MGKMVGKPSIARKLHQIPCNYIFFAIFGDKRGLTSMQLTYVRGITSMHITCVCVLSVQQGTYMLQKIVFLRRILNSNMAKHVTGKANAIYA
jgi:hypothetical protein